MKDVAALLLETARRGELHHSVILHGPVGDALRALAVRIAKTLNCLEGTTGDACASCAKIDRRTHPDVHFTEVDGEKKMISVDQVRAIVNEASLRPYEGRNKVFVIDPADAISISGSNSLLKTLEEPVSNTTFVLITRSPDLLLPTIRSRSQSIYVADGVRELTGPAQSLRVRQVALVDGGDDLALQMLGLLHRFASKKESAALLALAAIIGGSDRPADGFAILASLLCDAVGLDPSASFDPAKLHEITGAIPREKLLAAADVAVSSIGALKLNADARLLAEQTVAALVTR